MKKIILGLSVVMLICTLCTPAYATENVTKETKDGSVTVTTDEDGKDTTVFTDSNGNTITITDLGDDVDEADIDLDLEDDLEEFSEDSTEQEDTGISSEVQNSEKGSAVEENSSSNGIIIAAIVIGVLIIAGGVLVFRKMNKRK